MNNHSIIWLTGPSGAGKTTIAKELQESWPSVILDGDEMRASISLGAGFSREDRAEHNLRVARLADILSQQMHVIVAVIAPMISTRNHISATFSNIHWVYVKRNVPECEGHFYEGPKMSHYLVVNTDILSPKESVTKIRRELFL